MISKSGSLVVLFCPSLCFCFEYNLEAKKGKVDPYFVNQSGETEDAPHPLPEGGDLPSSRLDSELGWRSMGLLRAGMKTI